MYKLYIENVLLPIAPQSIQVTSKNQNSTISLIDESEFNVLKTFGLTEYDFSLTLPRARYNFALYENSKFLSPGFYLEKLKEIKRLKKVVDFTLVTDNEDLDFTNKKVTIESLKYFYIADGSGDIMLEIKLKDYSYHATKILNIKENKTKTEVNRAPTSKEQAKTYVIKSGDTLQSIAIKFYANSSKSTEIYAANKELLDSTAVQNGFPSESGDWWIFVGTKITLP